MVKNEHKKITIRPAMLLVATLVTFSLDQIESFLHPIPTISHYNKKVSSQQHFIPANSNNANGKHADDMLFRQKRRISQLSVSTSFSSSSPSSSSNDDQNYSNRRSEDGNRDRFASTRRTQGQSYNKHSSHFQHQQDHHQQRTRRNSRNIRIVKKKPIKNNKHNNNSYNKSPLEIKYKLQKAKEVEKSLSQAIKATKELICSSTQQNNGIDSQEEFTSSSETSSYPSVRECNAALAIMGDTNDFKRALRLFGQMRKAQMLVSSYNSIIDQQENQQQYQQQQQTEDDSRFHLTSRTYLYPPSPTLVTYSTLMSRAVSLGKQQVALRLWRLMILQEQFYTNFDTTTAFMTTTTITDNTHKIVGGNSTPTSSSTIHGESLQLGGAPIIPDIKAVNILMNVFAKMADHESATLLMEQIYDGNVQRYDPSNTLHYDDNDNGEMESPALSLSKKTKHLGVVDETKYLIKVVPKLIPNIVTYNTLIDACHRAGDLDAGKNHQWQFFFLLLLNAILISILFQHMNIHPAKLTNHNFSPSFLNSLGCIGTYEIKYKSQT